MSVAIHLGPKLCSTDEFQKEHVYWHKMSRPEDCKFVLCTQSEVAPDNSQIVSVAVVLTPK